MKINIAKKISEGSDQQQIEKYWLDTLKKYKNPFLGLLSGFQKKDSAFFMLISCIVNDVLRDITIGYDTEIQTLNLKARRLFENLLLFHWINRHSPREVYIQFAKEQILFCQDIKKYQHLTPAAILVLDEQIKLATNGARQLGIIGIEKEKCKRINFKNEAEKANLKEEYFLLYNISSTLIHGGIFSSKFRHEQPSDLMYKNMIFSLLSKILPLLETEIKKIKLKKDTYK